MNKNHFDIHRANEPNKKKLKMKWIRTPDAIWGDLSTEFQFTVDACASDKTICYPGTGPKKQMLLSNVGITKSSTATQCLISTFLNL